MQIDKIARSQYIFLLFLSISLILTGCDSFPTRTQIPITVTPISDVTTSSWLQIYFTNPNAPNARDYEGGPDQALASAIDEAHLSVDVAAYSLNLWSIRDALVHAHQRGVVVRIVMESDNMDVPEVQDLKDNGIPIIGDKHEGLMHNKFVIIDHSEVWTGSMNYTVSGAYKDNNNLIRIRSVQVAGEYTKEFEEMFIHKLFGADVIPNTPNPAITINGTPISPPSLTIDGTRVEIYFSPDDGVAKRIVEMISGAQESISFMAYAFTSNDIGDAVMERAQAGIKVDGVMDGSQVTAGQGTEYDPFMQAGLDVRLDGNTTGLMHHKVIIIDHQIVITGSYNFTTSAEESNDENVVIIFSPDVATKYMEEFKRIYEQAL
jgi:phosphatidylserine/phosphatidylglycerophosphate/cardiolipin synthase-like enzyme